MTKIIGLTGGIGSGKTTVAGYFESMGVPVYYADNAGKKILGLEENKKAIKLVFGESVFDGTEISRKKLASIVFNDKEKLSQLNQIIHPAVRKDFTDWLIRHNQFSLIIKEAAILFESGTYKDCDAVITIVAPLEVRINRVMSRDNINREEVMQRIVNQWPDEKKIALSDFVIENDSISKMQEQVREILKKLQNI